MVADVVVRATLRPQQLAQSVLNSQQDLDATGAGADDADVQVPRMRKHAVAQALPMRDEAIDRLDRHDMSGGARHVGGTRRRADVERKQIVTDRWVRAAMD